MSNREWAARPEPAIKSQGLGPTALLKNLWVHRELIRQLIWRDVSQRYRGSLMGVLWSFITPLLLLFIYTFVFSLVLKVKWGQGDESVGEFALTLFAGLNAFNLFAEIVSRSPGLILAVPNYVKRVPFPLEVLPFAAVCSACIHSFIAGGVLVLGCGLLLGYVSPTLYLLPLAYAPLVLLCLSAAWLLSSLGVYVRDIGQVVGLVVQGLFFMSPVFYSVEAVPMPLRLIMYVNPLTTIISGFRRVILWRDYLPWLPWAGWLALSLALAWLSYIWFIKTKKGFADVL